MLKKHWPLIYTIAMIVLPFTYFSDPYFQDLTLDIVSAFTLKMAIINGMVLVIIVNGAKYILKLRPWLEWRLLKVNLNFLPLQFKYLGLIYLIIFAINLPFFAYIEEMIFRLGTASWPEGIARSLLFGLVHMLIGVSLGAALILSLLGLWLTHWYFVGGIMLASANHALYNLLIIGVVLLGKINELFRSYQSDPGSDKGDRSKKDDDD